MFLGKIVGQVWATKEVSDLQGKRLLVVEALDDMREPGASKVTPVIAVDPIGAGIGEHVIVAFGKAARVACGGDGDLAYEAAVVGIVDDVHAPGAPESWRPEGVRDESESESEPEKKSGGRA